MSAFDRKRTDEVVSGLNYHALAQPGNFSIEMEPLVSGNRHPHGATDVRLRSDEPQADQHQYTGQDGEQEAIGNAGRHVATD
jgi:hypothetical protein